ncbi:MAG: hypothetical protein H6742_03385 [Alphaproteobacteria bacterium]|nr:hypothetical protein [Alphaproteobacteria bacterium]
MLLLLALVACRGDGKDAVCDLTSLVAERPADGADPVSRSASLVLAANAPLGDVDIQVQADGVDLDGDVVIDGSWVSWTPRGMMPADAQVEWTADSCGVTAAGGFTTGSLGDTVDAAALQGQSWALDLDRATWLEPPGGQILLGQVFGGDLLLGVQASSGATLDLIGGAAEEVEPGWIQQDPCIPTFDFDAVDFGNNPYISVGPTTLELDFEGVPVVLSQVYLGGVFVDGGAGIEDASLQAEIDARDVAGSLGGTADQLCDLVESYFGIECIACSTDAEPLCLALDIQEIPGTLVPGLQVVPNPDPQECDQGDPRPEG